MEYEQIDREIKNSAALKLLRSQNAALIISFLYKQFKLNRRVSISQTELETNLSEYLYFLRETYPESYPRSAKEYLNDWCADRLLRKTFDRSDDPVFGLTPDVEKAIAWLEDLQKREEFIVTESRFLEIFNLLKEIRDGSTIDVEARLAQLESDRERIDREIEQIRQTGVVERYDRYRLRERFIRADGVARQLTADFREIEQKFHDLARKVQEAQLEKDNRKGTVVGRVLDADRELKESPQGRSFYAFWNFLMSDTKRQELKSIIQAVYQLEELGSLTQENSLLRRIDRELLNEAKHIVESNQRLAEKLRQMLDERNFRENRRVAELITEVQRLALAVSKDPPSEPDFWTLSGEPDVRLVMERPLHPLESSEMPTFSINIADLPDITLEEEVAELSRQFYIDEESLEQRIQGALQTCTSVSLPELIQLYPITQGLPEIVGYLAIATRSESHLVDPTTINSITIPSLEPEKQLQLTLPQIVFHR